MRGLGGSGVVVAWARGDTSAAALARAVVQRWLHAQSACAPPLLSLTCVCCVPGAVCVWDQVKARIREENLSINGVSNEPLRIKVFAPHFHNLTIVDLPGYINAVKPPMPHTVPKQITGACLC